MQEFTDEEVEREVGKIVSQFQLYQRYECARVVNGIEDTAEHNEG